MPIIISKIPNKMPIILSNKIPIYLASILLVLLYHFIIHYNYNYYWQFARLNFEKKWARLAFARSCATPRHDPGRNAPPRSKRFSWKPNCRIRKIRLYYQIILFSPTEIRNFNSARKTKSKSRKEIQKLEAPCQ